MFNAFTLSQAAAHDKVTGARQKLTGWGKICALRAGENSKSQRRKRNARIVRSQPKKESW